MTHKLNIVDGAEAAAILGMSEAWLKKRRVLGGGPQFVKMGRLVKYRISDLEKFIESQVRSTTSDHNAPVRQPPARKR